MDYQMEGITKLADFTTLYDEIKRREDVLYNKKQTLERKARQANDGNDIEAQIASIQNEINIYTSIIDGLSDNLPKGIYLVNRDKASINLHRLTAQLNRYGVVKRLLCSYELNCIKKQMEETAIFLKILDKWELGEGKG